MYRDVADLMAQRVPITGAAGLGYLLAAEYDIPPLMLNRPNWKPSSWARSGLPDGAINFSLPLPVTFSPRLLPPCRTI